MLVGETLENRENYALLIDEGRILEIAPSDLQ